MWPIYAHLDINDARIVVLSLSVVIYIVVYRCVSLFEWQIAGPKIKPSTPYFYYFSAVQCGIFINVVQISAVQCGETIDILAETIDILAEIIDAFPETIDIS